MPNNKQANKRVRQNEKRREENKVVRTSMRTAVKKVLVAETGEAAQAAMPEAMKRIDKARQEAHHPRQRSSSRKEPPRQGRERQGLMGSFATQRQPQEPAPQAHPRPHVEGGCLWRRQGDDRGSLRVESRFGGCRSRCAHLPQGEWFPRRCIDGIDPCRRARRRALDDRERQLRIRRRHVVEGQGQCCRLRSPVLPSDLLRVDEGWRDTTLIQLLSHTAGMPGDLRD